MSSIQSTPATSAAAGSGGSPGASTTASSVSSAGPGATSASTATAGGSGTAAGGKAAQGAPGATFSGTLIQFLSGTPAGANDASPKAASNASENAELQLAASILALLGGAKTAAPSTADAAGQSTNTAELSKALEALADLLQNTKDLQDVLTADPQLMTQLQLWIQQALQLLQGMGGLQTGAAASQGNVDLMASVSASGQSSALPELPMLAKQPDTMKFALLDTIQSLKELVGSVGPAGISSQLTGSFDQLVSSLQKTLGQLQNANVQPQNPQLAVQVDKGLTPADQTTVQGDRTAMADRSAQQQPTVSVQTANEDSASNQNQSSDQTPYTTGSNVVTAGQLQLRDGTAVMPKAPAPVPVDQFAQEMTRFVVSKLDIVKLQGMSEAKISLTPEHLGQVDIRITLHNGQLVAQFVTEHAFAKDSLEQQMSQLRTALQSQGLQVEKLEVTQNASLSSHMYQDGKQSGSGSQQRENNRRRTVEEDDGLTSLDSIEEWNEWVKEVQSKQENYGSSFVAKA
ncbi:flagellar hook-length control protein FliK [Paenibacillus physcomitrellae]|uniref:Flagellar hook-length control protein-like C-terminal domain-containing protein n=1 Tax=Paenibacillus physcomitrellae TaxID=1619311 RepID=A0ABQ1GA59_9BACL|nr:flagellar hook-length control protein FliK [Paenibacillus physcomitrellae]GGA39733.1 hypothetical protein GCM10010917_26230 [Paenibacillus physcomitrellae]